MTPSGTLFPTLYQVEGLPEVEDQRVSDPYQEKIETHFDRDNKMINFPMHISLYLYI